jgi:hypothetical protein
MGSYRHGHGGGDGGNRRGFAIGGVMVRCEVYIGYQLR